MHAADFTSFVAIGFLQELYPSGNTRISNEEFHIIVNSVCCSAHRRMKN